MNHLFIEDDVDHLVDDTDSGTNDVDDATVPNDYSDEDTCFLLLFFSYFCVYSSFYRMIHVHFIDE